MAVRYRTPVMLLSDGALANGSEPWKIPDVETLPTVDPGFATEPNAPDGSGEFWPYLRDPETLARPWAIPGTAGLEHRVGGLEKADGRGSISYDPDNHDRMVRLRQAKIEGIEVPDLVVDDPDGDADFLVVGWGRPSARSTPRRGECASSATRSPPCTCATSTRCRPTSARSWAATARCSAPR